MKPLATLSPPPAAVPRMAATTIVVRPAMQGMEVLMLERADKGDRNSGAWVFPGGLVDSGDRALHSCCTGLDDAAASERLGLREGGLDFYVAAIRETFEEAGLLFARTTSGGSPPPAVLTKLAPQRGPIARGEHGFGSVCRDSGLWLAPDLLHYVAHRVTPQGLPKRFDTRFFLAVAPADQEADCDAAELVRHGWFVPRELLREAGTRKLLQVTRSMLELLAGFEDLDSMLRWAQSPRVVRRIEGPAPVQR